MIVLASNEAQEYEMNRRRFSAKRKMSSPILVFRYWLFITLAIFFASPVFAAANPAITSLDAFSGRVEIHWEASTDSPSQYRVYQSSQPFSSVEGMDPVLVVPGNLIKAGVAALQNGTTYYFALTVLSASGDEEKSVNTASGTPKADESGPRLSDARINTTPLVSGVSVNSEGSVSVNAQDPSGVGRVEFYVDDQLISVNTNGSERYESNWSASQVVAGSHDLVIRAYDTFGNTTEERYVIEITNDVPQAPAISSPVGPVAFNHQQVMIEGDSYPGTEILFSVNGNLLTETVVANADGHFRASVGLSEGSNSVVARARYLNRSAISPNSSPINITIDKDLPDQPSGLRSASKSLGRVKLEWQNVSNVKVAGYRVYRSQTEFEKVSDAGVEPINGDLVSETEYDDLISDDGTYYYRVTSVTPGGQESELSGLTSLVVDSESPEITQIQYQYPSNYNSETGRVGTGQLKFEVEMSEKLSKAPYFAVVYPGGSPTVINLVRDNSDPLRYSGRLVINDETPSGTAYILFSGYDKAGNRGTRIVSGDQLKVDTVGPVAIKLAANPSPLIDNNPVSSGEPVSVTVSLQLTEALRNGGSPTLVPLLQGEPVSGYQQGLNLTSSPDEGVQSGTHWTGELVLPSDAGLDANGQPGVDALTFELEATDKLNNATSIVLRNPLLQVFQGGLPPAAAPESLLAKALPKGKVRLKWQPVDHVSGYNLYRKSGSDSDFNRVQGLDVDKTEYVDGTSAPLDGNYTYAVTTLREGQGKTAESAYSPVADVKAISSSPSAPVGLQAALDSDGVQLQWPTGGGQILTYNVYRASSPDGLGTDTNPNFS